MTRKRSRSTFSAVLTSVFVVAATIGGGTAVAADPVADLSVTTVDSSDPVVVGNPLTYTLTVANGGPDAVLTLVRDFLPTSVSLSSMTPSQGTCQEDSPGFLTCFLGPVGVGESPTVEIVVVPQVQGSIENRAFVAPANGTDPQPGNNSDSELTDVGADAADLSITNGDSPDPVVVGEELTYSLVIENAGPEDAPAFVGDTFPPSIEATDVRSITPSQGACEPLEDGVLCNLRVIRAGEQATVEIVVVPDEVGTITNSAGVFNDAVPDPDQSNNRTETTTEVVAATFAHMSLQKVAFPDPATVGEPLTYTLVIDNAGPDDVTDAVVTDTLPNGVTFESAAPAEANCTWDDGVVTCAVGAFAVNRPPLEIDIVVTPNEAATITNTATVESELPDPNPDNNTDSTTTVVNPGPRAHMSLQKVAFPDPATVGEPLTYTLVIDNAGPDDVTDAVVTDTLPNGVTFESAAPAEANCTWDDGVVTCAVGAFVVNRPPLEIDIVVTPNEAATITNTATVESELPDPNPDNNTDSTTTVVNPGPRAHMSLQKVAFPDPATVGEPLTYTLVIDNAGPDDVTDAVVTDTLPNGVTFESAAPAEANCTWDDGVVTCAVGAFAVNRPPLEIDIVVTPNEAATITNTATVESELPDPNPDNNTDSTTTVVNPGPRAHMSLQKVAFPDPATVGEPLTYTLVIDNAGPDDVTDAVVTDTLPNGVTFESAAPAEANCTWDDGVVTCAVGAFAVNRPPLEIDIVVTPNEAATITNTATVESELPDPNPDNNTDSTTTVVNPAILVISVSENVGVVEMIDVTPPITIEVSENVGVVEVLDVIPPITISVSENVGVVEMIDVTPPITIQVSENVGVVEMIDVIPPITISVSENVGVVEVLDVIPPISIQVSENVGVVEVIDVTPPITIQVSENVGVVEVLDVIPPILIRLVESIGTMDALSARG